MIFVQRKCQFCNIVFPIPAWQAKPKNQAKKPRGQYCSDQCKNRGVWLKPHKPAELPRKKRERLVKYRGELRALVHTRHLNLDVQAVQLPNKQ